MKKTLFVSLFITVYVCLGLNTNAQDDVKVPAKVKEAFNNQYPDAMDTYWYFNDPDYEVSFSTETRDLFAYYDAEGTWIETLESINYSELPQAVKTAIKSSDYSTYEVTSITLVERSDENAYKILFYNEEEEEEFEVTFDSEGNEK